MDLLNQNYSDDELADFESQFSGYTSLRQHYQDINDNPSEYGGTVDSLISKNVLLHCPDDVFATVLSSNGNIQIGDTIYCYRPGSKNSVGYKIPSSHADDVADGDNPSTINGSIAFPATITSPYKVIPMGPYGGGGGGSSSPTPPSKLVNPICEPDPDFSMNNPKKHKIRKYDNQTAIPNYKGHKVRIRSRRYYTDVGVYKAIGVKVKIQRKGFLGWQKSSKVKASKIVMAGCAEVMEGGSGPVIGVTQPQWPGFYVTNNNVIKYKLDYTVGRALTVLHFNIHFWLYYNPSDGTSGVVERDYRK